MFLFNRPSRKRLRQRLRNQFVYPEIILWQRLRRRAILNKKFRRQYGIGPYVVDFFCPELRLAIEIDDSYHLEPERKKRDRIRQAYIEAQDIRVVRFTSTDVVIRTDAVVEKLIEICSTTPSAELEARHPPLPTVGGEPRGVVRKNNPKLLVASQTDELYGAPVRLSESAPRPSVPRGSRNWSDT